MPNLIISVLLFLSVSVHAESLMWRVGPVHGMVESQGQLTLESLQAKMLCHYCTPSTCAGGPTEAIDLQSHISAETPSRFHLMIESGTLRVRSLNNRLHSCTYRLDLMGRDAVTGLPVSGSIKLAYSVQAAANPIWYDEMLSYGLTEILTERPLRVEIRKLGLSEPAIYPVDKVPYFDGK